MRAWALLKRNSRYHVTRKLVTVEFLEHSFMRCLRSTKKLSAQSISTVSLKFIGKTHLEVATDAAIPLYSQRSFMHSIRSECSVPPRCRLHPPWPRTCLDVSYHCRPVSAIVPGEKPLRSYLSHKRVHSLWPGPICNASFVTATPNSL